MDTDGQMDGLGEDRERDGLRLAWIFVKPSTRACSLTHTCTLSHTQMSVIISLCGCHWLSLDSNYSHLLSNVLANAFSRPFLICKTILAYLNKSFNVGKMPHFPN